MSIVSRKIIFLKHTGIGTAPSGTATGIVEDSILEISTGDTTGSTSYLVKGEEGTVYVIKPKQIISIE